APVLLLVLYLYVHRLNRHRIRIQKCLQEETDDLLDYPTLFNMRDQLSTAASGLILFVLTPLLGLLFWYRATTITRFEHYANLAIAAGMCGLSVYLYLSKRIWATVWSAITSCSVIVIVGSILFFGEPTHGSRYRWDMSFANVAGKSLYGRNL